MRNPYILFILLFLSCLNFFSQSTTFSVSLFYEINETQSNHNFKRLDSVYDLAKENNSEIKIIGHADFLNDDQFNQILSQKRADLVKNYLLKKPNHKNINIIDCEGVGEKDSRDNSSVMGEPFQRRVDVFITLQNRDKNTRSEVNKQENKKSNQDINKNINEIKQGESIAIDGLSFIPGRHVAVKSSMIILESLVKTLKQHPNLKIEVQGHICCMEGEEDGFDFDNHDRKLSENRARAVYDYLIKNGIDATRLSYKGYGHTKPKVDPETSEEEEQMNRRVEIKVLED